MGLFGLGGDDLPRDKRDLVDSLKAEFEGLKMAEGERLTRYRTYREENEAARQMNDLAPVMSEDYDRVVRSNEYARHKVQLPFGMALTVKHSYRIAGRLPDAVVDRREESAEERYRSDTMEKMWWGIIRHSNADTVFGTGAWHGSMLGSSCFDVYMDVQAQIPRVRAVDPAGILVVRGVDDPHDFQRVYRYWQVSLAEAKATYRGREFSPGIEINVDGMNSTHKVGSVEMATLVEMSDRERTVRFALGTDTPSVPLVERNHKLGFVPYVVIPNIGPYDDIWGWSDYEFVRSLVAYLPKLFSREADILKMVANGAVIEAGTGQDPNTVRQILREGGVVPSRREGKIEPIQAPEVPAFETAHAQRAMEMFKMLGFAPDGAWGTNGVLTTGTAKALDLQPLLEYTAMKQTNWSAGLSRLARYCFQIIEAQQATSATYRGARPGTTARQTRAFTPFKIGPGLDPLVQQDPTAELDPLAGDVQLDGSEESIILPRSPEELFQGDYSMRFVWQNRIDPDDPSYVLSELNKFAQGAQSLRTTLERLGFQSPEDEMKLIEDESARFPWLRQGMIALIQAQLRGNAQGQGGGNPGASQGQLAAEASAMTQAGGGGAGGAYSEDAGAAGIGGLGSLYGGA